MTDNPDFEVRPPSKPELAMVVRMMREARGWTQETLAELAGVNVRTIQRLEEGQGASADTRRAVGRAVEAEDIDFLIKPRPILTAAGAKRQVEAFERENLLLDASPVTSGRSLEGFMVGLTMLSCGDGEIDDDDHDSLRNAAELFDYLRDYLDLKAEIGHCLLYTSDAADE